LSPAQVTAVEIVSLAEKSARVVVPDFQLSLAIGKEGQNARLAARLTGWRVDIKSETQLADEEAYQGEEWAQGEWVVDAETGEQVWVPAEGGESISAEDWAAPEAEGGSEDGRDAETDTEAAESQAEAEPQAEAGPQADVEAAPPGEEAPVEGDGAAPEAEGEG
jgi:N utilization substance protein A